MATASSLLSEEKFLCSVCLDVFTDPVSTPCGHNFCSACIHKYWDSSDMCQCPLCKRVFSSRPELLVNTVMSELAADYKTLVQAKASPPGTQLPETADVPCDICSEKKVNAVKSCLTCLASFCEVHLEPHRRVAGLKSHTLLDPVKNLDDRMCKTHSKITELYCRTDQACICVMCFKTDHKGHNVVPLEEEYEAVMARKDETVANIQKMIQSRSEKIAEIENSVDVSQKEAEKEKEASVQVFTDLICSIQRSQAELVEVIEERYRATKQKAEGFLTQLKMEVAELESRSNQLEQLSQSEDHHHFLQSFPTLCSPLDKDWSNISVQSDLSFEGVRGAVTLLKQRVNEIMEELPEIKMKRMREHAVDLTFDPDTAFCSLVISEDGKQVICGDTKQSVPYNPKRFETCTEVLAKEGFTTGKFYYEVQVKGKTDWIVGVVRESINRKEKLPLSVKNGAWVIGLDDGIYGAFESKSVKLTLKKKLQKVGIFVAYEGGVVSFYNVNSKSHMFSFTGYHFTEKLYPYFGLQGNENGKNSAPLIITPVPQTH
ncbi:zinc finger protein RFP-like isoform X7 [Dicentrarchus labrax]|uniref:zinc finger protein RFP-like isoform X7 n=1 Tax=Dicentrarchus labrax TaxID=13489 RepID=UPI0021F5C4A7|nr:zinc finger protein RFP-like isoform X7 [Dicentrarchus labrax]